LLYTPGGVNADGPPGETRPTSARIAAATGSVVAELRMVPNEPLQFKDDPTGPRKEDRLIAWGWSRFLKSGDPTWLPRLPMTKAAVRAMDTITAYFDRRAPPPRPRGPRAGPARRPRRRPPPPAPPH